MAQDPNAPADDHGNGNGNGDPNGDGAPKTQLELAMDNLLELGIPNLQPLDYTEDQMTKGTVGEMNDWAKKNLDAASYQSYRALRRKESKIEWLVLKIKSINEARGSLLARLQGVAPVVQQQQVQQQQQPGEQGGDQDQDMKENDNGNGNKKGETDAGEDKTEKRLKTMETAILNMQNMFNQVLDKQYGGNNNGTKNGTSKNANDEKLDENEKKKMNEDIARIMNTQRVENGSNDNVARSPALDKQLANLLENEEDHWSDQEDDKKKTGVDMAMRAQTMIEYIRKSRGISYQAAYRYLKERPEMLKKAQISEQLFEKYDLSKIRGRNSYKRMIYSRLINRCEYQMQINKLLVATTGQTKENKITESLTNDPIPELMHLFIMEHMKYELEVCRGKYKNDKDKLIKHENRIFKVYELMFDTYFWDTLLLDEQQSQVLPLMNALDLFLKKQRERSYTGTGDKVAWSTLYDAQAVEIRKSLGVRKNLSFHHGTTTATKRVVIPKRNLHGRGNGDQVSTQGLSNLQIKSMQVCVHFNRPGGCKDPNCTQKHICGRCFASGHHQYNCWQQMRDMEKYFIERLVNFKNYSISDQNGNSLPRSRFGYGGNGGHGQSQAMGHGGGQTAQELPNGMLVKDGVVYTQLTGPPPFKKQKTGK